MIDLEKVIKGLEVCLDSFRCGSECPYFSWNVMQTSCMKQLQADALALLKQDDMERTGDE